jgi:hypothetical protein
VKGADGTIKTEEQSMPRESTMEDRAILESALTGLQSQLNQIDEAMAGIRSQLRHGGPGRRANASINGVQPVRRKRNMTAAARKRIGEATRKRWAAYRKQQGKTAAPAAKPKRKMSKAGRAAISAATKKRWRAFHKAQKAAATTA